MFRDIYVDVIYHILVFPPPLSADTGLVHDTDAMDLMLDETAIICQVSYLLLTLMEALLDCVIHLC